MKKINLIFVLTLLWVVSCKQQEDVKPSKEVTSEVLTNSQLTYVYKGKAYNEQVWLRDFTQVHSKAYMIIEKNTCYAFDKEQEALNFDSQKGINQRGSKVIPWIVGGLIDGFTPSPSISASQMSRHYQFKLRFYEHTNFRGAWVQYKVSGELKNSILGLKAKTWKNRFAPNFRKRVSSAVIDEIMYPRRVTKTSLGPFEYAKSSQPHGQLSLKFYTSKNWKGVKWTETVAPYFHGRRRYFPNMSKWKNLLGKIFGASFNDKIQSFSVTVIP